MLNNPWKRIIIQNRYKIQKKGLMRKFYFWHRKIINYTAFRTDENIRSQAYVAREEKYKKKSGHGFKIFPEHGESGILILDKRKWRVEETITGAFFPGTAVAEVT